MEYVDGAPLAGWMLDKLGAPTRELVAGAMETLPSPDCSSMDSMRSAPITSQAGDHGNSGIGSSRRPHTVPPGHDLLRATLIQLSQGLLRLHSFGVIHRGLKPSNVLVAEDGRVVILDFGLVGDTRTR